jgi:hypothetical protein
MNEKPGLEPGFFARRAAGGLTGSALPPVPRTCLSSIASHDRAPLTSGLPRLADTLRVIWLVSKVPKGNIDSIMIRPLRWQGS